MSPQTSLNFLVTLGLVCATLLTQNNAEESSLECGVSDVQTAGKSGRTFKFKAGDSGLWPDGVVYYKIDEDWPTFLNSIFAESLITAVNIIQTHTCVRFVEASESDLYFVKVTHQFEPGCWASVGRQQASDQPQTLSLGRGCHQIPFLTHQLLHVLGMLHEHVRDDRDDHVKVNFDNVIQDNLDLFDKVATNYNYAPYNLNSLMHFTSYEFSDNGKPTLEANIPGLSAIMGGRDAQQPLTHYDIMSVNRAYFCQKDCGENRPVCHNDGFLSADCSCVCPRGFGGSRCEQVDTDTFGSSCSFIRTVGVGEVIAEGTLDYVRDEDTKGCAMIFLSEPGTQLQLKIKNVGTPYCQLLVVNDYVEIRHNLPGQRGIYYYCKAHLDNRVFMSTNSFIAIFLQPLVGAHFQFEITSVGRPVLFTVGAEESFEQDDFHHKFYDIGDVQWRRNNGPTSTAATGPNEAHTGSYYVYMEASSPVMEDQVAIMVTKRSFSPAQLWCLSFYYHMNGQAAGSLKVYIYPDTSDGSAQEVWAVTGSQGDQWMAEQIHFLPNQFTYSFHVGFVAIRGVGDVDIAVDDIEMGACPVEIPPSLGPLILSEGFEDNSYTKFDDRSLAFYVKWRRRRGGTPSLRTGPSSASEGRWYMYFQTSLPMHNHARVWLETRRYFSGPVCLIFSSHLYGPYIGRLEVRAVDQDNNQKIWEKVGNQGNQWNNERITVTPSYNQYIIAFIAFRNPHPRGWLADIAIDDIRIYSGVCPQVDTLVIVEDFEDGFTNTHRTWGGLRWLIRRGGTPSSGTGPAATNGQYAYIESSEPRNPGITGKLYINGHIPPGKEMCLSFLAQMYGDSMGSLQVFMDTDSEHVQVLEVSGDKGQDWLSHTIHIPPQTDHYSLYFKATSGPAYRSDICLDNIVLVECDL